MFPALGKFFSHHPVPQFNKRQFGMLNIRWNQFPDLHKNMPDLKDKPIVATLTTNTTTEKIEQVVQPTLLPYPRNEFALRFFPTEDE